MLVGPKSTITLQKMSQVSDNMGGFQTSWMSRGSIPGILTPVKGNRQMTRDGVIVQVNFRFIFDKSNAPVLPVEKDRFLDGNHVYEVLWINKPPIGSDYFCDLVELEKP